MGHDEFGRFCDLVGLVGNVGKLRSRWINAYRADGPYPQYVDRREPREGPGFMLYNDKAGTSYGRSVAGEYYGPDKNNIAANILQQIFNDMVSAKKGAWVHAKAGPYNMGTASPAVTYNMGGFRFTGEGPWGADWSTPSATDIFAMPTTRFLAGAANQTLFQATSGKNKPLNFYEIADFCLDTNGFTGIVGMDMTNANEIFAISEIRHVMCNFLKSDAVTNNGQFSYGWILDGNDGLFMNQPICTGRGTAPGPTANADIHWDNPLGEIVIYNPELLGANSLLGKWSQADIGGGMGTINPMKLDGNAGATFPGPITHLHDLYLGAGFIGGGHTYDLNGFNQNLLAIEHCSIRVSSAKNVINLGAGVLQSLILENCHLQNFDATAVKITDNIANCGIRRQAQRNNLLQGVFAGNPWTVDANGYLGDPGFITTTPAVPASTVAQQNTNPYPVDIIILTATGATATITDPAGTVSAAFPIVAGGLISLGAMAKLTPTYTTLTWKWYGKAR
jgi:hypothetical protein